MAKSNAVKEVAMYIIRMDLYDFNSLSDDTQERLTNHYGSDFGSQVNQSLDSLNWR